MICLIVYCLFVSLWFLACLLFFVISSYVSVTVPLSKMYSERTVPDFTMVTKSGATIQICVWIAVYLVFIYLNEEAEPEQPQPQPVSQ